MKKYILIAALLLTASTGFSIFVSDFKGWGDLIENSPEIVVARCVSTLDSFSVSNKTVVIMDDMHPSKIEVVSVLKGTTNSSVSEMASGYWPYRGEYLLIFANYRKDDCNHGYTAIEGYRVLPLGHFFMTNQIGGQTLNEQIQSLIQRRLWDLNQELSNGSEEKKRLEEGFPIVTNANYRIQAEQAERKQEEEEFKRLRK